ncbi:MAG: Spy/CpxP family protein refolding chaperone [Planctomycetota bacterium]|nr:Spy/CpxP family protein refolding chaperone [Planctomycetota bacterium]
MFRAAWAGVGAWARVLVALVALALGTPRAGGQDLADQLGPMGQVVPRASVAKFADMLGLTADQREIVRTLHETYRLQYGAAMREGRAKFKAAHEKAREAGDWNAVRAEGQRIALETSKQIEVVEREFFDNLRAVLTPEQEARFGGVERARRREVGMRFAFASGSQVDLNALCEELKVPREGEVGAALLRWEEDIDRVLRVREATLAKVFEKAMSTPNLDDNMKLVQEIIAELFQDAFRVRDMNRRYAREIAGLLDANAAAAFDRAFRARSFPGVYQKNGVAKLAAAVRKAGIDAERAGELDRLEAAYRRDVMPLNDRLAQLIEEREQEATTRFGELMAEQWSGGSKESPLGEAWKARRDLDDRTVARLRTLAGADAPTLDEGDRLDWGSVARVMPDFDDRLPEDSDDDGAPPR